MGCEFDCFGAKPSAGVRLINLETLFELAILRGPVGGSFDVDETVDKHESSGMSESLARLLPDPGLFDKGSPPAWANPRRISLHVLGQKSSYE